MLGVIGAIVVQSLIIISHGLVGSKRPNINSGGISTAFDDVNQGA